MPYSSVDELPKAVLDKYESPKKLRAFMQAFNSRYESCVSEGGEKDKCEESAFSVAHSAAQRAGEKATTDERIASELKAWLDTEQHVDPDEIVCCERCQDTDGLETIAGLLLCEDCMAELVKATVKRFDGVLRKQYAIPVRELSLGERLRGKKLEPETQQGFKVLPGRKWVAWYSNTYKDLEDERFSEDGLKADIAFSNQYKLLPELWFYHLSGSKHGQATHTMLLGDLAVAVGSFDDTPIADKMIDYYQKNGNTAVSHGFWYFERDKRDGVYHRFHTFEVSALPRGKEANLYTRFVPFQEDSMAEVDPEALKLFESIVGTELAQEALAKAPKMIGELKAITSYKAQTDSTPDAPQQEATETPEQATQAPTGVTVDELKSLVQPLTENVTALTEAIKTLHKRLVDLERVDQQRKQQPKAHNLPNQPAQHAERLLADLSDYWQQTGQRSADGQPAQGDETLGLVRELLHKES